MDIKKVGNQIAELRKLKGLTQSELGERLCVSFQAVSKWERGETLPDTAILPDLANVLETTTDFILTGGERMIEYKGKIGISDTIAKLVDESVLYDDIKLIVTATMSGFTARKISNLRPNCTILAICPSSHIAEKVSLNFGVKPVITDKEFRNMEELVNEARILSKSEFNLSYGDKIVITGGFPFGESNNTNFIRIIEI